MVDIKKVINFILNEFCLTIKLSHRSKFSNWYQRLLYPTNHALGRRVSKITAALLCITTMRFWLIILSLFLAIQLNPSSASDTIIISVAASGAFYILFVLFPEQLDKLICARLISPILERIVNRRATLYGLLLCDNVNMKERRRFVDRNSFKKMVSNLNSSNGLYAIDDCSGVKLEHYQNYNYAIKPFRCNYISNRIELNTMRNLATVIAEEDLADINRIISIPKIESFTEFYETCNYVRDVFEKRSSSFLNDEYYLSVKFVNEFVATTDKLLFSARNEFPRYLGRGIYLGFKPTKEQLLCARHFGYFFRAENGFEICKL